MAQTNAGITGALETDTPRLTLVPARCAVGISASGAGFRVVYTLSGQELGIVARLGRYTDGNVSRSWWGYACSQGCVQDADFSTADIAATALDAHILEHRALALRDQLALAAGGEVA